MNAIVPPFAKAGTGYRSNRKRSTALDVATIALYDPYSLH